MYLSGLNLIDLILEIMIVECIAGYGIKRSTEEKSETNSAFAFIRFTKVDSGPPTKEEDVEYHR